jgi:cell division protein FtsQ
MEMVEEDPLPIQDDLDSEEESPYLRRQKSPPVRRSRIPRRARLALFLVGVLLPVGLVGYGLATFALTSPIFVLNSPNDIVVEGNHFVSREEVLGALGVPLMGSSKSGTNVFRMSLETRQRGVEALPWVRTASITRILPHDLLVHITERTPVAYANVGGHVSMVDEDGILLEKPDNGAFDFPVLYGLDNLASLDDRRARLALYSEFMHQLQVEAPKAGWMISEVYLSDAEDLKALLINGHQTVEVHFGQNDFLERFRNFLALLPEIEKSDTQPASVDLRYRNQVVVDGRTSATASGTAAATGGDGKE